MNKVILIALSICVLTTFVAKGESSAQTSLQKTLISYSSGGITSIDLFIAREKGYFREEGLDPQLVQMRASIAITAGISGDVDALRLYWQRNPWNSTRGPPSRSGGYSAPSPVLAHCPTRVPFN